jgi:hypothetical protein
MLVSAGALAQTTTSEDIAQSDWLDLVKGSREEAMGAEVRSVETDHEEGYQRVILAIPKASVGSPDAMEEVLVIGRKPEKPEPLLDVEYQWLDDYDAGNYGLLIRIGGMEKLPIRLYLDSGQGFIR